MGKIEIFGPNERFNCLLSKEKLWEHMMLISEQKFFGRFLNK